MRWAMLQHNGVLGVAAGRDAAAADWERLLAMLSPPASLLWVLRAWPQSLTGPISVPQGAAGAARPRQVASSSSSPSRACCHRALQRMRRHGASHSKVRQLVEGHHHHRGHSRWWRCSAQNAGWCQPWRQLLTNPDWESVVHCLPRARAAEKVDTGLPLCVCPAAGRARGGRGRGKGGSGGEAAGAPQATAPAGSATPVVLEVRKPKQQQAQAQQPQQQRGRQERGQGGGGAAPPPPGLAPSDGSTAGPPAPPSATVVVVERKRGGGGNKQGSGKVAPAPGLSRAPEAGGGAGQQAPQQANGMGEPAENGGAGGARSRGGRGRGGKGSKPAGEGAPSSGSPSAAASTAPSDAGELRWEQALPGCGWSELGGSTAQHSMLSTPLHHWLASLTPRHKPASAGVRFAACVLPPTPRLTLPHPPGPLPAGEGNKAGSKSGGRGRGRGRGGGGARGADKPAEAPAAPQPA